MLRGTEQVLGADRDRRLVAAVVDGDLPAVAGGEAGRCDAVQFRCEAAEPAAKEGLEVESVEIRSARSMFTSLG